MIWSCIPRTNHFINPPEPYEITVSEEKKNYITGTQGLENV